MDLAGFSESVRRRFRAPSVNTTFARLSLSDPIAISRVTSEPTWTERGAPEDAFTVHIQLSASADAEMYANGKPLGLETQGPGAIRIVDMSTSPYAHIRSPVEFVRIIISRLALAELSYDRGQRPIVDLRHTINAEDPLLYGLGTALAAHLDVYALADQLFIDHLALAIHAHITVAYGQARLKDPQLRGLAPWQFRRACEMMAANLSGDMGIADLATACELSKSYFISAFRKTAGVPPHRWLMNERVNRAKRLLQDGHLPLADIAAACGFADQSHLCRVFSRFEGRSPGRWRRMSLHS